MICLALALLLGSLCDSLLGTFSKTVSVGYIVFFCRGTDYKGETCCIEMLLFLQQNIREKSGACKLSFALGNASFL
jgi:hypothetical protein